MQHETMKQTTTREFAQKRENWPHVCPPAFQNVPHTMIVKGSLQSVTFAEDIIRRSSDTQSTTQSLHIVCKTRLQAVKQNTWPAYQH